MLSNTTSLDRYFVVAKFFVVTFIFSIRRAHRFLSHPELPRLRYATPIPVHM
jgi:hypothetical protein